VLVDNKKTRFFPINVFYLHRRQIPQGSSALLQVTKSSFSDGRVVSSVVDGLLNFGPDIELYHVTGRRAAAAVERRIMIDWANYVCHRTGTLDAVGWWV